ncbi:hypothetical protein VSAK1_22754 [Vibrio mediterranei AK1]|nr:hypothetical protein VSAK1_22754 [Vibrio mediterranei AK1]
MEPKGTEYKLIVKTQKSAARSSAENAYLGVA